MHWLRKFVSSEDGAEVSELAIVLAILVAGSVGLLILIGPKVAQMYTNANAAVP